MRFVLSGKGKSRMGRSNILANLDKKEIVSPHGLGFGLEQVRT
jgi:hypothetical protein